MKKTALVIGLGLSGRSALKLLLREGFSVVGVDRHAAKLEKDPEIALYKKQGLVLLDESNISDGSVFAFAVLSPGIPLTHPLLQLLLSQNVEIIGEIELACRFLHPSSSLVGVTGTNGKTTVVMMVAHVLNQLGKTAKAVGNIGVPLTQEVNQKDTIFVCELSSYQIETIRSKAFDSAVILNITPDHLDRYGTMDSYAAAKIEIGNYLKEGAVLWVHPLVHNSYKNLLKKYKKSVELFIPENYKEPLNHDEENCFAAFALCRQFGVSQQEFNAAAKTFLKPPHRIEFVRTFQGIHYYNDSKGTNLDAVIRAVESMQGKVVLIAGGRDKGSSYRSWIEPFRDKVKEVIAIGEAKKKIQKDLEESFSVILEETLESAIVRASSLAEEGDNVLLSPGCSSLDMFKNFEERGNLFKERVIKL